MSRITLDPELRSKLNGLSEPLELCDESGKRVGIYLPWEEYRRLLYRDIEIPFSPEEIEQRRNEQGGSSLAEVWKRMGVS